MSFLLLLSHFLTGGAAGLGSADFDAREAASARLTRHGVLALPVLWEAAGDADPEVRSRAVRILGADRTAKLVQRLAPLWRARCLIYDGPSPRCDAWQIAEVKAGDPELWDALDGLAGADGLMRPDETPSWWHVWHVVPPPDTPGPFDAAREVEFVNHLRGRARSVPDAKGAGGGDLP